MPDKFSIASRTIKVTLLWTPFDSSSIAPSSEILKLDTSQSIELHFLSIYSISAIFFHFSLISLDRKSSLPLPNTSQPTSSHFPLDFRPKSSILHLVWSHFSLVSCISFIWPKFWVLEKFLSFLKNFRLSFV